MRPPPKENQGRCLITPSDGTLRERRRSGRSEARVRDDERQRVLRPRDQGVGRQSINGGGDRSVRQPRIARLRAARILRRALRRGRASASDAAAPAHPRPRPRHRAMGGG